MGFQKNNYIMPRTQLRSIRNHHDFLWDASGFPLTETFSTESFSTPSSLDILVRFFTLFG